MIFTALGLLVVAAGLLLAGIAKSSVALLMASLLLTLGAGVVLAMVVPAARKLAAATGGGAAPAFATPQGQPVVLYVQQAPVATNGAAAPAPIDLTDGGSPFVGYDVLTAKQITDLVDGGSLTAAQLVAIREYETANAGRRTVLNRLEKVLESVG
jgi:hypothetical protein